ncbi:MAG TPA: PAS domain S-box protein [Bryobacteraceae bacterium]|nr:PAS domain S-box protein [Bryobacteraceae bacterium]
MSPASQTDPPARRPLKILLYQPNRTRLDQVVTELKSAGFEVHADVAPDLDSFQSRLRDSSYDLVLNGLQFASAVHELEQQRKRAEDAATAATAKVQALFETCPLAIMSLDLNRNIRLWNRGAEQMFGWRADEVLGKPLPTIPPGEEQEYEQLLKAQFNGISHAGVEVHRQRRDGSLTRLSLWTVPLRDPQGAITGNVAILAETADARSAEQRYSALLAREEEARSQFRAERRFRQLLEAAPDAILEIDAAGRIVLVNAGAERLSGYSREELLGQSLEIMVPSELRAKHVHHRRHYWEDPNTRPMGSGLVLNVQRKDGELVPVEISLSPVHYDTDTHVTAIVRDISERKRAEAQIREIQERLTAELTATNQELAMRNEEIERANRLKTEFVASMSHELRTPLHTIIGFAELVAEELEGPLNEKQKRFIGHIYKDSLHLLELINDVLDISRIEAGRLELRKTTFDLTAATDEVLATIRPQALAKSLHLDETAVPRAQLHADRVRFKEILYNLLSNAIKFTPEGGRISVNTEISDGFANITVRDSGIGIPAWELSSIFDKFYQVGSTTRGVKEGTGLGLAITKQLVEAHGGKIWVQSDSGQGSSFHFSMPLEGTVRERDDEDSGC